LVGPTVRMASRGRHERLLLRAMSRVHGVPRAERPAMADPRRLVPRQSHTVCRRTRSRALFLNPSSFVNHVVLYCLGLAQQRHGIAIHAATFESTHYHLGITDAEERSRLSDFEHDLNENVARALNAHYDRSENFWSKPGSYGNTEVHTLFDQE